MKYSDGENEIDTEIHHCDMIEASDVRLFLISVLLNIRHFKSYHTTVRHHGSSVQMQKNYYASLKS